MRDKIVVLWLLIYANVYLETIRLFLFSNMSNGLVASRKKLGLIE